MVLTQSVKDVLDFQPYIADDTNSSVFLNPRAFTSGLPVYYATTKWHRYNFGRVGTSQGGQSEVTILPEVGSPFQKKEDEENKMPFLRKEGAGEGWATRGG